jgi:hypothetical protein
LARRGLSRRGEASVREEIEYIPKHAAIRLIYFRVLASRTRDGREAFALHVEYLGKEPASRPELANLIIVVRAFGTCEIEPVHAFPPRIPFNAHASLIKYYNRSPEFIQQTYCVCLSYPLFNHFSNEGTAALYPRDPALSAILDPASRAIGDPPLHSDAIP